MAATAAPIQDPGSAAVAFKANTNYTVLAYDRQVYSTGLTATKTFTLPTLATTIDGQPFYFGDTDGSVGGGTNLVIDGAGAETISGAATKTITTAWGQLTLRAMPSKSTWIVVASVGTIT